MFAIPFPPLSPEIFEISLGSFTFALRWYALAYLVGLGLGWWVIVQACKLSRNACSSFLASFINVKYDDKALYSEITLTMGNKEPVTCYGLLTRVICPDL